MLDSELLNYIIKAFQLIEKGPFHRILTYLRPSLSDKDIPHHQTLCNEIINKANLSKAQLKELLKVRLIACCTRMNIHSDARMSLVRCCSPMMPGHHRSVTHTCPSWDILSMVWVLTGSCIQNSLLSLHCWAAILVLTLAM